MLLPTKRRRLFGKQAAANLLVAQEPLDVPPVSEEPLPLVPEEGLLPEAGNEAAEPESRFDFLNQKTISSLVLAVLQSKTDQELHTLQVKTVLADVLAKAEGKINEPELAEKRDEFIAASMRWVPRVLSQRLLTAVRGKSATVESDVKIAAIDQKTWQKSYLITLSGLGAATAPSHEEIKDSMLNSFRNAGYSSETKVTHTSVSLGSVTEMVMCTTMFVPTCRHAVDGCLGKRLWLSRTSRPTSARFSLKARPSSGSFNTSACYDTALFPLLTSHCLRWIQNLFCSIAMASILRCWTQFRDSLMLRR